MEGFPIGHDGVKGGLELGDRFRVGGVLESLAEFDGPVFGAFLGLGGHGALLFDVLEEGNVVGLPMVAQLPESGFLLLGGGDEQVGQLAAG